MGGGEARGGRGRSGKDWTRPSRAVRGLGAGGRAGPEAEGVKEKEGEGGLGRGRDILEGKID